MKDGEDETIRQYFPGASGTGSAVVLDDQARHESQWAAIVAARFGCIPSNVD